jgi:hypothetical protein
MTQRNGGDSLNTLQVTSCDFFAQALVSLFPAVGALLSAIALWVASRARSTSKDAQSTSSDLANALTTPPGMPERRAGLAALVDRSKS